MKPLSSSPFASVVPPVIGDWLYERVASIRYRVFGKRDACELPAVDVDPERLLDPS